MNSRIHRSALAIVLSLSLAAPPGALLRAQATPAAAATPPPGTNADTGWPRTITLKQRHRRVVSAAGRKLDRTEADRRVVGRVVSRRPARRSRRSARSRSRRRPRCPSTIASCGWTSRITEYNFKSLVARPGEDAGRRRAGAVRRTNACSTSTDCSPTWPTARCR